MSLPSFCIKYKVLKPHPAIAVLSKSFLPHPNAQYLLARTPERSVRKYRAQCQSIELLLQAAEWRLDVIPQVARCFFLQLLKPNRETRAVEYEVYVEHLEVEVEELRKLIAQESFYLLVESAKGYHQLFSKYKRACVGPSTIGLNAQGRCMVWLHPDLSSFHPANNALFTETGIISAIIEEVRKRSEPICQGMLGRMVEEVRRKQLTLSGFIEYVKNLAEGMKVVLPQDLKYLVNQHKILINVRNIKEKTDGQQTSKSKAMESRTQRYRPSKTETRQNVFAEAQSRAYLRRDHRMSQINILSGVRVASSFQSRKFVTEKNITRKKQSYLSTNMSSFIANSDKKWTVCNHSKCTDEEGESSNKRIFSKSRQRTVISKCKSSEGRPQSDISVIYARPFDRLNFSQNEPTNNRSQEKTYANEGYSPFSERANSFKNKQHIKSQTKKVYKSFVVQFGNRIAEKNKCIGEECEEHESSPNKQKSNEDSNQDCVNRSADSIEGDAGDSKAEELLKANQWIKNLDSHQLWVQSKLNTSITLGQQKSTYLDDVKLQKLELLSRQMAMSRLPGEIYQPLLSQTIID